MIFAGDILLYLPKQPYLPKEYGDGFNNNQLRYIETQIFDKSLNPANYLRQYENLRSGYFQVMHVHLLCVIIKREDRKTKYPTVQVYWL